MTWAGSNEADIQAAQSQEEEQARVPRAHEDEGWAQDAQPPSEARTGAARRQDRREVEGPAASRGERLPRRARIRLGSEIRELLERGKRKRTANVDVFFSASPVSHSRIGLVVPKHGHSIVQRNRLKRRLREIGRRRILPDLDAKGRSRDVLIRARYRAYDVDFQTLSDEVRGAVEELCSEES